MRVACPRIGRALCSLVATSLTAWSLPAVAIDKATCVDAAEAGQRLRKEGRLISARDSLLVCASPECPEIVSQDCTGWLGEVQRRLASVVVRARDTHGEALSDVVVSLDGATLTERAPTAPIDLDPGDHVFRCERTGFEVAQQRARLAEGERGREIVCELKSLAPPPPTFTGTPPAVEGARSTTTAAPNLPWTVWALGGLGVVGLGSYAMFELWGNSEENSAARPKAQGGCRPDCTPAQVDPIRTKYLVADVSLGVGLAALAAAVVIGLIHVSRSSPHSSGQASGDAKKGVGWAQLPPIAQTPSIEQYPPQHAPTIPLVQLAPASRQGTQVLVESQ